MGAANGDKFEAARRKTEARNENFPRFAEKKREKKMESWRGCCAHEIFAPFYARKERSRSGFFPPRKNAALGWGKEESQKRFTAEPKPKCQARKPWPAKPDDPVTFLAEPKRVEGATLN